MNQIIATAITSYGKRIIGGLDVAVAVAILVKTCDIFRTKVSYLFLTVILDYFV